jgi:hypothetical protein
MKKLLSLCFAICLLSTAACQKGAVEGTYKLDKDAMLKEANAEIAKMPKEKQEFGKFALMMIQNMEMSLSLDKGGKAIVSTTMPNPFAKKDAKPVTQKGEGTWKQAGKVIAITITQEKQGKAQTQTMNCELSSGVLSCRSEKKKQVLYFRK